MIQSQLSQLFQRATAQIRQGNLPQAEKTLETMLKAAPNIAEAQFQLANVRLRLGRAKDAAPAIAAAARLKPEEANIWQLATQVYDQAGDDKAALTAFDRLIALRPKDPKPSVDKAVYLQKLGQFDQAETLFRKILKKNPYNGEIYRIFLATKSLAKGDSLIGAMQRALKHPQQTDLGRMHLGFALGKAMEDIGQPEKVFRYLTLANGLQGKAHPFDKSARQAEMAAVRAAQSSLPSVQATGAPAPIFVCGMPRSGTTLVERIIGAHSDVTIGGELGDGLRLAYQRFGAEANMQAPSDTDALTAFATDLRAALTRRTGATTGFVTDKAMLSDMIFGLLAAALPDARFVVVKRDPRAIALSIYKNHFVPGTHRYATKLEDIAWMIHQFEQNVAYWQAQLPGRIYELSYENLVSDPDTQSRALIDAVNLDWQDACLTPHKTKGGVHTLSLYQVRQPIQSDRAAAWRVFEDDLKPFTTAWEQLTA